MASLIYVDSDQFADLKSLKFLDVSDNNLAHVTHLRFSGPLIKIDFSKNNLENTRHDVFGSSVNKFEVIQSI